MHSLSCFFRQAIRAIVGLTEGKAKEVAMMEESKKEEKKEKKEKKEKNLELFTPHVNDSDHPAVYLSMRQCDFAKSRTVQPRPTTIITTSAPSSTPRNVTLSSFDPQRPCGSYVLDCRTSFDRCLGIELAMLGRLVGVESWDCPRVADCPKMSRSSNNGGKGKKNGSGSGKDAKKSKRGKGKALGSEWFEDLNWHPAESTVLTLTFVGDAASTGGEGGEEDSEWFEKSVGWSEQTERWRKALKTTTGFVKRKARERLAKNFLIESLSLASWRVVPLSELSFRQIVNFLQVNLLPYERLDPAFTTDYAYNGDDLGHSSTSGMAGTKTNAMLTTHHTHPAHPGTLASMVASDRYVFFCVFAVSFFSMSVK